MNEDEEEDRSQVSDVHCFQFKDNLSKSAGITVSQTVVDPVVLASNT